MDCPCGSGVTLEACCGRYHEGLAAPTALLLMKSRYSAYVLSKIEYLVETHAAATRQKIDREAVERWSRDSTWLGLEIIATDRGGESDKRGLVDFKASYKKSDGETVVHHERSTFVREGADNRWVYVDGVQGKPVPIYVTSTGRNEPCPCGSGKKFKRCCINTK